MTKRQHTGYLIPFMWTLLIVFATTNQSVLAQSSEVDSLKLLIDNSRTDTFQVDVLNHLSYTILNQDPEETIKHGLRAREMSELIGYGNGKANALKNIGLGYYYLGDYLKVLDYWSQSLESFEAERDTAGIANMLNNLGAIYYTQGSNSKAIEFFSAITKNRRKTR